MLTRKQIIDEILSYVQEETMKEISYRSSGSGYFIFDIGDDFNTHFKIKGSPKWLFGIWITDNEDCEDETKRKPTFTIEMFGQHEWYIDKFKPSHSEFSFEYEISKDSEHIYSIYDHSEQEGATNITRSYPYAFDEFTDVIKEISLSSPAAIIKYYWKGYTWKNPFAMLVHDFWYHEIKTPVREFFENQVLNVWLHAKRIFHTMLFHKYTVSIKIFDANEEMQGWKCNPRFTYQVKFKKDLDAKLQNRLTGFVTPLHAFDNVRYDTITDGEKRGYYIESEAEDAYRKFRDETIGMNWGRKFPMRFLNTLKYICCYPVYWFKYKFEPIE